MPRMYARAWAMTRSGVGAEAPLLAHDDGIRGVVPDVHDGSEVPGDAGLPQRPRDVPGLELRQGQVVGVAEGLV